MVRRMGGKTSWTVIGSGHGGQAMAGYLAMRGEKVTLYNRTAGRLDGVRKAGGVRLEGVLNGFGRLARVTSDIGEAIENSDIVMVVVPASAHGELAMAMAPFLHSGHAVVLNPGRTLGSVAFAHRLLAAGAAPGVVVAETDTFVFASRWLESGRSVIQGVKHRIRVAALPATRTAEVVRLLRPVFPEVVPAGSVIETGLSNIGAIFHPAPTLLNTGRVEGPQEFDHYHDGITPGVARALETLDAERLDIAEAFRVSVLSAKAWLASVYGVVGETLHKAIHNTIAYVGLKAPRSLDHRYVFEDVPASLVPLAELGRACGRPARVAESLITIAGAVTGVDWRANGRTLSSVGLEGLGVDEITDYVTVGLRHPHRRALKVMARAEGMDVEAARAGEATS